MMLPLPTLTFHLSLILSPQETPALSPRRRQFLNDCHLGRSPLPPLSCCYHRNRQVQQRRRQERQPLRPKQHTRSWCNHSQKNLTILPMAMIPHHCSKYDDGPLAAPPSTDELVSVSATTKLKILRSKILQQITNTATSQSSHSIGQITLLLVAFLYGTLNSTLRAIYAMDGKPVPSVLSFVRQLLSVVTFLPMILVARTKHSNTPIEKKEEDDVSLSLSKKDISSRRGQMSHPVWRSALELAFWNFGAQGLINAGLLHTSAARASFLTQTSVVMTPFLSATCGERIQTSVWCGCGLALSGLFLIATAATPTTATSAAATKIASLSCNRGDITILLGALSWSMYIFRTTKLAHYHPAFNLQFKKTVLLTLMYGGWFLSDAKLLLTAAGTTFLGDSWWQNGVLSSLWSGWKSPTVWMLLAYSAIGPGVFADLLQQRGQMKVNSASESNIILCLESVFAAVCAFVFVGEVASMREIAGGFLVLTAAMLSSR